MTAHQGNIMSEIERAWREFREVLDLAPPQRIEEAGVEGTWSVKDLIGHISTWEREAIDSIGRFLRDRDLEALAWRKDIDGFNERAVERSRSTPPAGMVDDLENTHAELVRLVADIEGDALQVPEVEKRIRVDCFEHYAEHAATIRRWLGRGPG